MAPVRDFSDPEATLLARSGGKGASLARLAQAGFPVPGGVIVAAEAYREFIAGDARLAAEIEILDLESPEGLHEQCEALRRRLSDAALPAPVRASVEDKVAPLLARGPVSVRSSSTMEDLAGAAFAGQHDTFLNVATLEGVLHSIVRCFASLWGDRAVRYRHERGFGQTEMSMAVVVQSMVPSEVAGVAFTMNPITGDLGQVAVNAAYGLGETVVSGEGDVDQFILAKEDGRVVEQAIATKTHRIVGTADGTRQVEVPADQRDRPCLSADQLARLVELAKKTEAFYAFPQDLEWAVVGKDLFLLQSRPITQFPARWTRDESAERFPNVITP